MKRILLSFGLLSMGVLCACNNNTNDEGIIIKDLVGREVSVKPGEYKKVCCIGAGALRLYSYVCDTNILCGVEDIDNEAATNRPKMFDGVARPYFIKYKDEFKNLPSCGVGGPQNQVAEVEKLLSCDPDIVISLYEDVEKEDTLQKQIGVPVITLKCGVDGVFDENFKKSIDLLGTLFKKEDRAKELNDFIASETKSIKDMTTNLTSDKKVYVCGLGNWGTTNHLMTSANYYPFKVSGINNVLDENLFKGVAPIENEKFIDISDEIDIMFIDAAAIKNIKPLYEEDNTMFDLVKAKNNDQIYLQMAYNAYYTNVEISLINAWYYASVVYDLDIDIKNKTNQITKAFLGSEMADTIYSYKQSYGGYGKIDFTTLFK